MEEAVGSVSRGYDDSEEEGRKEEKEETFRAVLCPSGIVV